MGKKTHGVDESDRTIPPANARPTVFEALAILRAVRKPGNDKLSLQEAIAVSQEQGEAFLRYQDRGNPIRRLQVLVEGALVMTISLDESSVNLESFHFNVESPHDAVMQILKADEGQEPVVLRNFPLCTVGTKGAVDITELPNGRICLQIAPPQNGRFDVRVAFAEGKDVSSLSAFELLPSRHNADRPKPSIPSWEPLANRPSSVFAVLFLVCLGLTGIVALKLQLASNRPITTPENSVAQQPDKKKPNSNRHKFKVNRPPTTPEKSCCDKEPEQTPSPEFPAPHTVDDISKSGYEEGTEPELSGSEIAGVTPTPEQVRLVSMEKPTIKLETETKERTSLLTDSNKVSVPLSYSNSEGRRSGDRDSFTQKVRFGFNRPQPD